MKNRPIVAYVVYLNLEEALEWRKNQDNINKTLEDEARRKHCEEVIIIEKTEDVNALKWPIVTMFEVVGAL